MQALNTTIPVGEASVEERSVSIKVLTIGTKQVTQSLYKQLVEPSTEYDLFDGEAGDIRSDVTVWGWVNICTDSCKKRTDSHVHVIYERQGILKKVAVSRAIYGPDSYGRELKNEIKRTKEGPERDELRGFLKYYDDTWRKTFKTIEDAGQLFIAVSGVWK